MISIKLYYEVLILLLFICLIALYEAWENDKKIMREYDAYMAKLNYERSISSGNIMSRDRAAINEHIRNIVDEHLDNKKKYKVDHMISSCRNGLLMGTCAGLITGGLEAATISGLTFGTMQWLLGSLNYQ